MKSISSPPLFQLPRRNTAGNVTGLYGGTISRNTCRSFTVLAKKNKSKNNQKKPPSSTSTSTSTGSSAPPPRLTSGLKYKLPMLKVLKESEKKQIIKPVIGSNSYRRKRVDKKETELSDDPLDFVDSDIEEQEEGPKVLLVDGYNVCGYWPKLKTEFMSGQLNIARQMLIEEMMVFNGMRDMQVVVVFDARKSGKPTNREQHEGGVAVVYSGETSADSWIHQEVKRLMEGERAKVTVATSDRAMMDENSYKGASVWSCATLISEIEDAHKEMDIENKKSDILSQRRILLKNVLQSDVRDGLKDLRKQLVFQEVEIHAQMARAKSMDSSKSKKNNKRPKIRFSPEEVHDYMHEARLQYERRIEDRLVEFRVEEDTSS